MQSLSWQLFREETWANEDNLILAYRQWSYALTTKWHQHKFACSTIGFVVVQFGSMAYSYAVIHGYPARCSHHIYQYRFETLHQHKTCTIQTLYVLSVWTIDNTINILLQIQNGVWTQLYIMNRSLTKTIGVKKKSVQCIAASVQNPAEWA